MLWAALLALVLAQNRAREAGDSLRTAPADSAAAPAVVSGGARTAPSDTAGAVVAGVASAAAADTAATPKIVRRLEEFVVRGTRLHDPRSSETVHLLPSRTLRALPLDHLADAIALKAGVVAEAGELHVRGGRTGELRFVIDGVALNEPLRDRPPELPLLAI